MGEFNWGYYQYHDSYNISYVGNNRQLITHTVTLDGYVLGIEDSEAMSFANNAMKADPPEDLSFPKIGVEGEEELHCISCVVDATGEHKNALHYTAEFQASYYPYDTTVKIGDLTLEQCTITDNPPKPRVASLYIPNSDGAIQQYMGLGLGSLTVNGVYFIGEGGPAQIVVGQTSEINGITGVITACSLRYNKTNNTQDVSITMSYQPSST
ncbi:MAG: hypothetical protein DRP74_04140 [Candidatus Omnitrophota bacterium]|nr:MAG: hypothetical protein DRP74_04140 [Candidatus Omnitrophota bacterium]